MVKRATRVKMVAQNKTHWRTRPALRIHVTAQLGSYRKEHVTRARKIIYGLDQRVSRVKMEVLHQWHYQRMLPHWAGHVHVRPGTQGHIVRIVHRITHGITPQKRVSRVNSEVQYRAARHQGRPAIVTVLPGTHIQRVRIARRIMYGMDTHVSHACMVPQLPNRHQGPQPERVHAILGTRGHCV